MISDSLDLEYTLHVIMIYNTYNLEFNAWPVNSVDTPW